MMRWSVILLCLGILLEGTTSAKETLDADVIGAYLVESNPYVYTAIAQRYIAQARAETTQGAFDTHIGLKYDKKQYPVSDGEFTDVFVEKPTESGVGLLLGYRKAEGTQEYNNIKTGDEGEFRLGVKVPVIAVIQGMNERKYRLRSATIDAAQSDFTAKDNLRLLRFEIFSGYYGLLYRKEVMDLESGLLDRARQRESYIEDKVRVGELPEIGLLEVRQQILNREQRLREAKNAYEVSHNGLLRYLGLTREVFDDQYVLPSLPDDTGKLLSEDSVLRYALENRPDLKALEYETDRYELRDDFIAVEKYPRLNVSLYGVHDLQYDNGFKVALDMDFPIERRQYHGKKREIEEGRRAIEESLRRKRIDIETDLSNRLTSLRSLQDNIAMVEQEIAIARRLEAAERKRFRLGASDLMLVNQRELYTLEARLRRLSYALRLQLAVLEVEREAGMLIGQTDLNALQADDPS